MLRAGQPREAGQITPLKMWVRTEHVPEALDRTDSRAGARLAGGGVGAAVDDPRPSIPDDDVRREFAARREALHKRAKASQ